MKAPVTEKKMSAILLFTLAFLLLSIAPMYRFFYYYSIAPGYLHYYHSHIGTYILNHGIPSVNPGVVIPTQYLFDSFDVLAGLVHMIHPTYGLLILPLLLAMATLFFIISIFAQYVSSSRYLLLAGIFIASCSLFLRLFTEASSLGFIAFLLSGGMYFFFKKNTWHYLAYIFLPLLAWYDIFHSIIVLGFLCCFGYKKRGFWILCGIIATFTLVLFFIRGEAVHIHFPNLFMIIQQVFSDIGGVFGFSIFTILLAVLGLTVKPTLRKYYALVFCIILFSFIVSPLYFIYLLPFITIAATDGFFSLLERQWKLEYLQKITIFLIILGILFSTTSTISEIATSGPTPETVSSLIWLRDNSYSNAIILTDKQHGFIVEEVSERRVIADNHTLLENIPQEISMIYYLNEKEEALALLEKYQVDYILLFPSTEDPSFLKTGENFKKVFENNNVRIWSIHY